MLVSALFKHWSNRLFAPDRVLQETYGSFKALLSCDIKSHELMAEFEELYQDARMEDFARIRARYRQLAEAVQGMVAALERMHPGQAGSLRDYFKKYDFYIRLLLEPPEQFLVPPYAVAHDQLHDQQLVGNKSRNLLLVQQSTGAAVPAGFTITATTGSFLIEHNGLRPAIDMLLASINPEATADLEEISRALMTMIRRMEIPEVISQAIYAEYDRIEAAHAKGTLRVAVRSSALHEDSRHSFAGQYQSVLGVDRTGLLAAFVEVLASKYTPEALLYRIYAGLSDEEAAMAVLVLEMVNAVASGVVYTRAPRQAGGADHLLIHSIAGLGLPLVGGEVVPDVYLVAWDESTPLQAVAGSQESCLVLAEGAIVVQPHAAAAATGLSLDADQALRLAARARALEGLFGEPQDIEWALDDNQHLFILQSRPLRREIVDPAPPAAMDLVAGKTPLLTGAKRASAGLCSGIVYHYDPLDATAIPQGAVLVTRHIPPSLVRYVGKLAGVVCEQGAVTGHFATVCREFEVVLLVQAANAFALLPEGSEVIVDGEAGAVYAGSLSGLDIPQTKRMTTGDHPFAQRLRQLLDYITPLHLIDPSESEFRPQSCRSLHDIIRYAHEKGVQTMFGLSDLASGKLSRSKPLATEVALDIYLLDVGGGFADEAGQETAIPLEQLTSTPFLAIWRGLSHPDVDWQSHLHFDWKGFGDMALSGGVSIGGAKDFASYAVVGRDYCNLNMRFGYHFTLVDCLCGEETRANYCQLRFAGGGGDYSGRSMRLQLLRSVLGRLGFEVTVRADLLDARIAGVAADEMSATLETVGRLLGATKLLDMTLKEEGDISLFTELFFQGVSNFSGHIRPSTSPDSGDQAG